MVPFTSYQLDVIIAVHFSDFDLRQVSKGNLTTQFWKVEGILGGMTEIRVSENNRDKKKQISVEKKASQ